MTTTYDPYNPKYLLESDLREELTRVFDLCHGCRMCLHYCGSFPLLFDYIDAHDGDAEKLSSAEQDAVVDECFQCKICYVKCPYIPPHEWDLDFPRLMMRANAVKTHNKKKPLIEYVTDQALARTDLVGTVSSALAPIANKAIADNQGPIRKTMDTLAGISSKRLLPPYAKVRFRHWFKKRIRPFVENRRAKVSVYPTCFIDYMAPEIGKDLVRVYEHNGIECSLPDGVSCCGAPWLHEGNVEKFEQVAMKNVKALAKAVDEGKDVVIAQPTCAYVVKKDYPIYVKDEDAKRVSERTYDASEYLFRIHKQLGGLKDDFSGEIPQEITYHSACHLQAQNAGIKGRDLIKLLGTKVNLVAKCSGIDGTWGYRKENYDSSKKISAALGVAMEKTGCETFVGDCHLANTAIYEETLHKVEHPLSVLARAYGIPRE
jgi:glycerol-3-phosphate dehydrogenase subunit C